MIPVSPETANRRHSGTLSIVLSILLHKMDKFIGYWLSQCQCPPPFTPSTAPFYLLPGWGWCQSGRPWGPSGDQWAVTGSSSASLSLQSGARWGLVRELSLPKWPHSNWVTGKKKKQNPTRTHCELYQCHIFKHKKYIDNKWANTKVFMCLSS